MVLLQRNPFQILWEIVVQIAIQMIDLRKVVRIRYKGFCDEAMDFAKVPATQHNGPSSISAFVGLQDAPDGRAVVGLDAPHMTLITDFVDAFKSGYGSPSFVHKSIITHAAGTI